MFKRLLSLIKKEFLLIWRDPRGRAAVLMPPLLQLFMFAHAVTMEIKNIDMAVLDRCKTQKSRELISGFENSIWFRKMIYVDNEKQFQDLIDTGKVRIGMQINTDFEKNLKLKKPTSVQIIVDGRQTNAAAIASGYAEQIISQFEQQYLPAVNGAQINVHARSWFNPNLHYRWFTLTILIALLSVILTLLLTALSIARERERGTFDQLLVSPLSPFEILIGKTVPALTIAFLMSYCMVLIAIFGFKMHFAGNFFLFFISTFIALLSFVGVGLFISSICKTQQQALLGVFAFQTPSVLLSGFVSPVEDMPVFLQYLTYLNPMRFHITITKSMFLKGMALTDVFYNLVPLVLISIATLSLANWMFKKKLD